MPPTHNDMFYGLLHRSLNLHQRRTLETKIYFTLVLLIARSSWSHSLAQLGLKAAAAPLLREQRSNDEDSTGLSISALSPWGKQGPSLGNLYFSRNSFSLSEHLLFYFQDSVLYVHISLHTHCPVQSTLLLMSGKSCSQT